MSQSKNKTVKTALLAPILLTSLLSIFGVGIGTYCWYEYQNHATVAYDGTAVGSDGKMDVGLVSTQRLAGFDTRHNMIEDLTSMPGKAIYWTREGQSLVSSAIMDYEKILGYSSNQITATSSNKYNEGENFQLHMAPAYMTNQEFSYAHTDTYSHMTLAFKTSIYSHIILKNSSVTCEDSNIREAVRVHFLDKGNSTNSFIYNPSEQDDGADAVGGILNLNSAQDSYFDYDPVLEKEHIYGQCSSITYDGTRYPAETPVDPRDINCFVSNHKKDLYVPKIVPEYAYYRGTYSVVGLGRTLTNCDVNHIATIDIDVYLEGWDKTCVEQALSSKYSLNLDFSFREALANE